jgi:hypothetical protein
VILLLSLSLVVADQPTAADALRVERTMASDIRTEKRIGYPEFEKGDTGEVAVGIDRLRCDGGNCSYDVIVESKGQRRSVHRRSVHFCQNPAQAWVQCVS